MEVSQQGKDKFRGRKLARSAHIIIVCQEEDGSEKGQGDALREQ